MSRALMQQALEALESDNPDIQLRAAIALRATLAWPEQGPVAWMRPDNRVAEESMTGKQFSRGPKEPPIGTWVPLYTAPITTRKDAVIDKTMAVRIATQLGWQPPNTSQQEAAGWIRAIDEALVVHHVGVADAGDSYEVAKQKLHTLLVVTQDIGAYFAKDKT